MLINILTYVSLLLPIFKGKKYDSKLRSGLGGNTWQMVEQPQTLCIFGNIAA